MATSKKNASILKNSPNDSVPFFIKDTRASLNSGSGDNWISFPDGMSNLSNIVGNEPIMLQSLDLDEPSVVTIAQLKTWMTGTIRDGDPGFIMGNELASYLGKFISSDVTINGHKLVGEVTLTKEDIGLGNVDNTSDENKPMSKVVRDKFSELDDFLDTNIKQLQIEVSDIDSSLDGLIQAVNNLTNNTGEFKNEFDDHLVDPNAHTEIRVDSIIKGTNENKIPTSKAVYGFVSGFIRNQDDFGQAGGYLPISSKDTDKVYKLDLNKFYKTFDPNLIWKTIVNQSNQFPNPQNLNPGTLVRIGESFVGDILYSGYNAKPYEVIVWTGTEYQHFGYTEPNVDISFNQLDNGLELGVIANGKMVNVEIPKASLVSSGIVTPEVLSKINGVGGLSIWGTPANSWEIGMGSSESITLTNSGRDAELRYNGGDEVSDTITNENGETAKNPEAYANLILRDLTILGDVIQKGNSYISEAEVVRVSDNMLTLNSGEKGSGVTAGLAGIEIDRGISNGFFFVFDESDDRFKVGVEGDLWPVMTRDKESNLQDGHILVWDATYKLAKTGVNLADELGKYLPLWATKTYPLRNSLYVGNIPGIDEVGLGTGVVIGTPNNLMSRLVLHDSKGGWSMGYSGWNNNGSLSIGRYDAANGTFQDNLFSFEKASSGPGVFHTQILNFTNQINLNSEMFIFQFSTDSNGDPWIEVGPHNGVNVGGSIRFASNDSLTRLSGRIFYKIWDEGNDGSGSGLDADLLDGKHASEFAMANEYLPLTGGTINGVTLFESGIQFGDQDGLGWYPRTVGGNICLCSGENNSRIGVSTVATGSLIVAPDPDTAIREPYGIYSYGIIFGNNGIMSNTLQVGTDVYKPDFIISKGGNNNINFTTLGGGDRYLFDNPMWSLDNGTWKRLAYIDEVPPISLFYKDSSGYPTIGNTGNVLRLISTAYHYHINPIKEGGEAITEIYFHNGTPTGLANLYAGSLTNQANNQSSWYGARNKAILRNTYKPTINNGFFPILSMAGNGNNIDFGTYNNYVCLSFLSDSDYNAGSNTPERILFTPGGIIKYDAPNINVPFARIDTPYTWTAVQDFSQGATHSGSDIRFKRDIQVLPNILDDLLSIDIISYTWDKEGERKIDTIGVSAQQLLSTSNPIFSRLVHERTDEQKTKFLDYDRVGVLALRGLQEEVYIRDQEIRELKEQINEIKSHLRALGF